MKMKIASYWSYGVTVVSGLVFAALAKAELYGLTEAAPEDLKRNPDIPTSIGSILAVALGFTGTIFFILVIYAGLMWMTAAGNEENIKKAQGVLKAAIIGLIIVLSAYAITKFVGTELIK